MNKSISVLLVILPGLISFYCSRGKDGQLFLGLALHTLLLFGMIFLSFKFKFNLKKIMIISLLYFGGSILGVFLYTQLDGMAGILLVFYPLFALVYFVIASLNLIFMQKRLR